MNGLFNKFPRTSFTFALIFFSALAFYFFRSSEVPASSQSDSSENLMPSQNAPARKTASQDAAVPPDSTFPMKTSSRAEASVAFVNSLPGEPTWKALLDENGLVTDLQNGIIQEHGQTKDSAFEFAKQLLPHLVTSPSGLSSNVVDPNPTSLSKTYHYEQTYKDPTTLQEYRVYGGYLTVSSRLTDGGIYAVTSGAKELGTPNLDMNVQRSAVSDLIQKKYANESPGEIEIELTPMIFMITIGTSELVWVSKVELTAPEISRVQTIFSAKDGRFIQDRVILFH